MKKYLYVLMFTFIMCSFFSCKKQDDKDLVEETQVVTQEETEEKPVEAAPVKSKTGNFESAYDFSGQELSLTSFHTDAHSKYLDDPMEFAEVPTQGIEDGLTAVVASHVCMIYPDEAFTFNTDYEDEYKENKLGVINDNIDSLGTPVPFGTLLQIGKNTLYQLDESRNGFPGYMFHFQDNWNYFYQVKWNDIEGWVFGADLYGRSDYANRNQIASLLYQTGGKYESFYPVTGLVTLEPNVKTSLENNKIAMQKNAYAGYVSSDDMIDLYAQLKYSKAIPIFITTDLLAHSQHLIFDRMLQYTEEEYFLPALQELTDAFIAALEARTDAPDQVRENAIQYFQVPQAIFRTGTVRTGDNTYGNYYKYSPRTSDEINQILSEYSEAVKKDYELIMNQSPETEAIFGEDEDFSQYKPRGHYTKNGLLETYFRAQMWYGRLHFSIVKPKGEGSVPQYILDKEAAMMLIVDTVHKDEDLYYKWSQLFEPVTTLIGMSDDLGFSDICPLWKEQNVTDFSEWASDPNNLGEFMTLCVETLRPPAITGQSVFTMYSEPNEETGVPEAPMGWRLMGQRFTYDSYVHEKVSPPRLLARDMVRGIDVMKAFGSKTADALLELTDYQTMPELKEVLNTLEKEFASYDSSFWNQTYYNQVLYQVKTQATFEQGAGFYFTETPAWNIKSQIAAHGTWAELRHDTILYVKQVYAERAGDGDFEPTYRIEPLPKPVHYVEPNIPFWEGSLASVSNLMKIYSYYGILDDDTESVLKRLIDIYQRLLAISKLEAEDLPVSENDNDWIATVASSLARLVLIHINGEIADRNLLKMACIADVYTNAELGLCLEVGVATPMRLYIPLNDSQGGKRIAIGYGFTYVEFGHPLDDRMTDEQWKHYVYDEESKDIEQYMPFWESECVLRETTQSFY